MTEKKVEDLNKRIIHDIKEVNKILESVNMDDMFSLLDGGMRRTVWMKVLARDSWEGDLIDKELHDVFVSDCEWIDERIRVVKDRLRGIREKPKPRDEAKSKLFDLLQIASEQQGRVLVLSQHCCFRYLFLTLMDKMKEKEELKKQGKLLRKLLENEKAKSKELREKYIT